MPGSARHKNKHRFGLSDDDDDNSYRSSSPRAKPKAPAQPQPQFGGAPPVRAGVAPAAAQQFQAPPACRVGLDLTPQQIAAAINSKRTKVLGAGTFGKVRVVGVSVWLGVWRPREKSRHVLFCDD
jgi:hypothetical protein